MQQVGKMATTSGRSRRASWRWPILLLSPRFLSIVAVAVLALMAAALLDASSLGFVQTFERIAPAFGAGVEQVNLTGHRVTRDVEIFAALDLANARSMASLDIAAARARVEGLPWIAAAELRLIFPNTLDVRVAERRAFAVWRHDGQERLIDSAGRVLSAVRPGAAPGLPVVAGAGAPVEARVLFEALGRHPETAKRLAVAERVAERRWTLHFAGGSTVHLDGGRESASIELALRREETARRNFVVDARAPGRVAVRPAREHHLGHAGS